LRSKLVIAAVAGLFVVLACAPASAIPIFAQRYHMRCGQCHSVLPELNAFGNYFRSHGYRLPLPEHGTTVFALRYQLEYDKQPAAGMERPEEYDVKDYDFIPARFFDNPIYAADRSYQKTLQALPSNLKRALFDGDWDVFAGQYFDRCDLARNTARAEEIEWQPWWPRWISIDWGFEHPAATYWHAQAPASLSTAADAKNENFGANGEACGQPNSCVVTYREYVTHRTSPCAAWVVRSERRQTAFIPGRRLCRFRKTGGKRSARFIFHRMRLPVVPTTLRWRNRWEMCSRRQAFRGPHRRMTIASTGKRCNRSRAGLDLCRARRAGIPSAQVTRSGRDSLHCDRPSWAGADGWECGTSGDACVCRSSRSGWLSA